MNSYQVCSAKDCINLASTGDDIMEVSAMEAELSARRGAATARGGFWLGN